MKALVGSEKQIKWAEEIRSAAVELAEKFNLESLKRRIETEESAAWYIDTENLQKCGSLKKDPKFQELYDIYNAAINANIDLLVEELEQQGITKKGELRTLTKPYRDMSMALWKEIMDNAYIKFENGEEYYFGREGKIKVLSQDRNDIVFEADGEIHKAHAIEEVCDSGYCRYIPHERKRIYATQKYGTEIPEDPEALKRFIGKKTKLLRIDEYMKEHGYKTAIKTSEEAAIASKVLKYSPKIDGWDIVKIFFTPEDEFIRILDVKTSERKE